jgi:hypothetical protein
MDINEAISIIEHLYSLSTSNSEAWSVIRSTLLKVQKPAHNTTKVEICPHVKTICSKDSDDCTGIEGACEDWR